MKKLQYIVALIISILIISTANAAWDETKRHTYSARGADGDNSDGDIGVISGESVSAVGGLWDNCVVMSGNTYYFYEGYDSGNTGLHDPPLIIVPWDMNADGRSSINGISGTSAWRLMSTRLNNLDVQGGGSFLTGTTDHSAEHEIGGGWLIDIESLTSGTSLIFDKATDSIEYIQDVSSVTSWIADGVSEFVSGDTDWSGVEHPASSGGGSGLTIYAEGQFGTTGVSTVYMVGVSGISVSIGSATPYIGFESGITEMITGGVTSWIIAGTSKFISGDTEAGVPTGLWNFSTGTGVSLGVTQVIGVIDAEAGVSTSIIKDSTGDTGGANEVPVATGGGVWAWGAVPAGDITFSDLTAYTEITAFTGSTGGVSDFVTGNTDWSGIVGDSGTTDAKGFGVVFAGNGTVTSGDSVYISSPISGTISWVEIISDNPEDMTISFDLLRGSTAGTTNVTIIDKIINTVTYSSGQSTYVDEGGTTEITAREYLALQLTNAGGGVSEVSVMIGVKTQGGGEGVSQSTLDAYTNIGAFTGSTGGVSDFVTGSTDWSGVVGSGGGGGSGLTTIQVNNGDEAIAAAIDDAPSAIYLHGLQGIEVTAVPPSGNSVFIEADNVHSQVSGYVQGLMNTYTNIEAFAGVSDFATNAELTAHTTTLTGVSGEALFSDLTAYTNIGAFAGVSDFATNTELTDHTTTLTGVSGEALFSELTTYTAAGAVSGVSLDFTPTGGVTLSGVSAVVITANIFNPDDVVSSVSDNIAIWHVNADKYPNGIIIDSVWTQQFGASGYVVNVEEWDTADNPSVASTIEEMTIAAGTFVEEIRNTDIDDRDIAAGGWIFLDLPTTETDQFFIEIKGRIK